MKKKESKVKEITPLLKLAIIPPKEYINLTI